MTDAARRRALYVIVCAAGPAADVNRLVDIAHKRDWDVQLIATPAALDFLDVATLETHTGRPVRSEYRKPGQPRSPKADAIIVAPASFNTINKWASGISDTYALGILAESIGLAIPVVVVPFVNSALAGRQPFRRSVEHLREEGVRVLFGPGEFEPHPPGTGDTRRDAFPWTRPRYRRTAPQPHTAQITTRARSHRRDLTGQFRKSKTEDLPGRRLEADAGGLKPTQG